MNEKSQKKEGPLLRFFSNRFGLGILYLFIGIVCGLIVSVPFYVILGNKSGFLSFAKGFVEFLALPGAVACFLLFFSRISEKTIGWLCYSLSYGTMLIAYILEKLEWVTDSTVRYILGFIIAALMSVIYHNSKKNKES